jgi:CheY-like chemotaxis protein
VMSTDRTLFTQLLQNLIGNSLKYTEHGFVRISQAMDSEALVLKIEDSGVGIPEDKLERIFDEYYQIGPQGTQRLGVGLGLAIVREVSRLLGYSIAVASIVGHGTCVSVRIPRHRLLSEAEAPAHRDAVIPISNMLPRRRLVLLEDNDSVRMATELYLTLEGFETHSAATVAEVEGLLVEMRPGDIFITDYHLDGKLTGFDVLQQLRIQQGRDVPAILLSGDVQSMMRVVKSAIPACRFLSKPVDTKALLLAIAELGGI